MTNSVANEIGIFDRSTVGARTSPVLINVERGSVDFFAKTIGETGSIHLYKGAAHEAGFPDVVAPITYPIALSMLANQVVASRGEKPLFERIGSDFSRLLHGEERYDYADLIYVGDNVVVQSEVLGFADIKGGAMEVASLKTTITHSERGLLVTMTSTAIHRLQ
jgi:MaoC dehydratase-like protein